MSLFTIRMFIPDAAPANPSFDRDGDAFGPSYGNRVASEQQFGEPWHASRRSPRTQIAACMEACCDPACSDPACS